MQLSFYTQEYDSNDDYQLTYLLCCTENHGLIHSALCIHKQNKHLDSWLCIYLYCCQMTQKTFISMHLDTPWGHQPQTVNTLTTSDQLRLSPFPLCGLPAVLSVLRFLTAAARLSRALLTQSCRQVLINVLSLLMRSEICLECTADNGCSGFYSHY